MLSVIYESDKVQRRIINQTMFWDDKLSSQEWNTSKDWPVTGKFRHSCELHQSFPTVWTVRQEKDCTAEQLTFKFWFSQGISFCCLTLIVFPSVGNSISDRGSLCRNLTQSHSQCPHLPYSLVCRKGHIMLNGVLSVLRDFWPDIWLLTSSYICDI